MVCSSGCDCWSEVDGFDGVGGVDGGGGGEAEAEEEGLILDKVDEIRVVDENNADSTTR